MQNVFWFMSAINLLIAWLPEWRIPHGIVRVFDFPRLILLTMSGLTLVLGLSINSWGIIDWVAFVGCLTAIGVHGSKIWSYTQFAKRQSIWVSDQEEEISAKKSVLEDDDVSFLVCNVKQGNNDYYKVKALIAKTEPDIVILMETDEDWETALSESLEMYPNRLSSVQDNSYGLIVASKQELVGGEVRFLLKKEVPSVHTNVIMPSGRRLALFAVHPEPPVPYADTIGRDAEISKIGQIVRETDLPVVVAGDLNDVAWSYTTDRFLRQTGLCDLRRGLGMFNSFHADYWFLRWPLDHLFHSPHLAAVAVERQSHVGSDHFPMYYRLRLRNDETQESGEELTSCEIAEINMVIETEKSRDKKPVGTDWEK